MRRWPMRRWPPRHRGLAEHYGSRTCYADGSILESLPSNQAQNLRDDSFPSPTALMHFDFRDQANALFPNVACCR